MKMSLDYTEKDRMREYNAYVYYYTLLEEISKRYWESAKVIEVNENEDAHETDVIIDVKGHKLKCFHSGVGEFTPNEECRVLLTLMSWKENKIESKTKRVVSVDCEGTPNHCFLYGEIKALYPNPLSEEDLKTPGLVYKDRHLAVVDCEVFIVVEVYPEKQNLKVGDYIHAEGRLDAWKIKEK